MGISIYLHVETGAIDEERWEAAYLTSLQLLEHFPGPLARRTLEEIGRCRRFVVTKDILRDTGSPEEHWEIDRELGSNQHAEPCYLYRHLQHYREEMKDWGRRERANTGDILHMDREQAEDDDAREWFHVGGSRLFDGKTQGYPYHYAVLAVGMLIESTFPRHALVRGDISRRQAEQTRQWAEAILGRPLPLPLVTDGPRLWERVRELFPAPDQIESAIRRFRALLVGGDDVALRVLAEHCSDQETVRRWYVQELDHYHSLSQLGASQLVRSLCDADGDVQRAIDWVCGPREPAADESRKKSKESAFEPIALLEVLCRSFITVPPPEREVVEMFKPGPDSLTNIEEMLGQLLLKMSGMPETVECYVSEEELLAAFVRRWPAREEDFVRTCEETLDKVRRVVAESHAALERWEENSEASGAAAPAWMPLEDEQEYEPTAEFIRAEILRQRESIPDMEDTIRELGRRMQGVLRENHELRSFLEEGSRPQLHEWICRASFNSGIELPEEVWREIDELYDEKILQALVLLAACPEREINFWRSRQQLLETPSLWPLLAGESA